MLYSPDCCWKIGILLIMSTTCLEGVGTTCLKRVDLPAQERKKLQVER